MKKDKRNVVIMDASRKEMLNDIKSVVEMFTGRTKWFNRIRPKKLDKNHPTMKIIKFKMNKDDFACLKRLLEHEHPGQCSYDVVL